MTDQTYMVRVYFRERKTKASVQGKGKNFVWLVNINQPKRNIKVNTVVLNYSCSI